MSFIVGYISGIASVILALSVLVIISKIKQGYDYFKHK